jgi:hypothetical protein
VLFHNVDRISRNSRLKAEAGEHLAASQTGDA